MRITSLPPVMAVPALSGGGVAGRCVTDIAPPGAAAGGGGGAAWTGVSGDDPAATVRVPTAAANTLPLASAAKAVTSRFAV